MILMGHSASSELSWGARWVHDIGLDLANRAELGCHPGCLFSLSLLFCLEEEGTETVEPILYHTVTCSE